VLKLSDLAQRPDLGLGPLLISPSLRRVVGPAGATNVEPLIMQALLLLFDARGNVVTRSDLFDQLWGGVMVGDDSLNRAIAGVRRIAAETAPGLFEVETIPRTGYRLTGEILSLLAGHAGDQPDAREGKDRVSRRWLIGGGAAAVIAAAGGGLWWATRDRSDPQFTALMARGDEALRNGGLRPDPTADDDSIVVALYEKAVRLEPGNAKAWGLLAYFKSRTVGDDSSAKDPGHIVLETQDAVRRALAIDPKEPNALTAMFLLQGPMLDWATREGRLRNILTIDATNIPAMSELMTLLQAAGFTRESRSWNERILKVAPLSRPHLVVRAMKLWILGDVNAADQVIDRVRGLWPLYDFGFLVRLMLFVLTARPRAALAMIDNAPENIRAQMDFSLWRAAAEALVARSSGAIEVARIACLDAARTTPWRANMAVMILGALGQTDAAFEVTDGYLLWRGKVVSANQADSRAVNDYNRRMTQWLFTPPVATMRADPRFLQLCEEFGLVAYWRARGVKPDYMLS
jgi:DNA-binding winged helix-turn-helix (wHTH) protein